MHSPLPAYAPVITDSNVSGCEKASVDANHVLRRASAESIERSKLSKT